MSCKWNLATRCLFLSWIVFNCTEEIQSRRRSCRLIPWSWILETTLDLAVFQQHALAGQCSQRMLSEGSWVTPSHQDPWQCPSGPKALNARNHPQRDQWLEHYIYKISKTLKNSGASIKIPLASLAGALEVSFFGTKFLMEANFPLGNGGVFSFDDGSEVSLLEDGPEVSKYLYFMCYWYSQFLITRTWRCSFLFGRVCRLLRVNDQRFKRIPSVWNIYRVHLLWNLSFGRRLSSCFGRRVDLQSICCSITVKKMVFRLKKTWH